MEHLFKQTILRFTPDEKLADDLWNEVVVHYADHNRHYHNFRHLNDLLGELSSVKDRISDWDAVFFAIIYHDLIYDPTSTRNEDDSATRASFRLHEIGFNEEGIRACERLILATKDHSRSDDSDTNFFTDGDLSVLGKEWPVYRDYAKSIRKEFSIYPDALYNPGRKKVLQNFLSRPNIFKTAHFATKYEARARENLTSEMKLLGT